MAVARRRFWSFATRQFRTVPRRNGRMVRRIQLTPWDSNPRAPKEEHNGTKRGGSSKDAIGIPRRAREEGRSNGVGRDVATSTGNGEEDGFPGNEFLCAYEAEEIEEPVERRLARTSLPGMQRTTGGVCTAFPNLTTEMVCTNWKGITPGLDVRRHRPNEFEKKRLTWPTNPRSRNQVKKQSKCTQ